MTQPSDTKTRRNQETGERLWLVSMLLLGFLVLLAYSSYRRPLWIDEFLHFALGGVPLAQAWDIVVDTTVAVNHGQTGVFMMLDAALMSSFGANLVLLRLPSLIAGAALLVSGVWFIRLKGYSREWQTMTLLALAGQHTLMDHAGEARPYMMLAAATAASLTYYSIPLGERRRLGARVLGVSALLVGALIHPYFPLMLGLVLGFTYWLAVRARAVPLSARGVIAFSNVPLLIAAAVVFFAIGSLTWMRGSPTFTLDPFSPAGGLLRTVERLLVAHFEWMPVGFLVLGLAAVTAATVWAQMRDRASELVPPVALLALGVGSSVVVSAVSAARSYWIFPRQWVAGIALATLGVVWLFAEISRVSEETGKPKLRIPVVAFSALVLSGFVITAVVQVANLRDYASWENTEFSQLSVPEMAASIESNDDWVRMANENVVRGGPVWPEIAGYYDRR